METNRVRPKTEKSPLKQAVDELRRAARATNAWWSEHWPIIIIVAGFVAVLPLNGQPSGMVTLASQQLSWWFIPDLNADYERGIAEAALKRPGYQMPLTVIPVSMINVPVAHFGLAGHPVDNKSEVWVALASELKKACSGDSNPTL